MALCSYRYRYRYGVPCVVTMSPCCPNHVDCRDLSHSRFFPPPSPPAAMPAAAAAAVFFLSALHFVLKINQTNGVNKNKTKKTFRRRRATGNQLRSRAATIGKRPPTRRMVAVRLRGFFRVIGSNPYKGDYVIERANTIPHTLT